MSQTTENKSLNVFESQLLALKFEVLLEYNIKMYVPVLNFRIKEEYKPGIDANLRRKVGKKIS